MVTETLSQSVVEPNGQEELWRDTNPEESSKQPKLQAALASNILCHRSAGVFAASSALHTVSAALKRLL